MLHALEQMTGQRSPCRLAAPVGRAAGLLKLLLLLDLAGAGLAKNPAELPLEAGDGCGSDLAGVCCTGADDWSKKPLLPDSFQSEGLLAFLKLLLLDLAGAGLAKNPAELPLEAGDGCGSALAGALGTGADDWSKKPLLPDSFQSEGLLAFLKLLLLDLAGAGLAKNPAELPLEAGDGCGSALAGVCCTGAGDWSKKPLLPDSFQSEGLLAFLKLLLLDLAGAGLAKNPAELPLEAGDGCGASSGSSAGFFASPAPAKSSSSSFKKASSPSDWKLSGSKGFFDQSSAPVPSAPAKAEPQPSPASSGSSAGFFASPAPAKSIATNPAELPLEAGDACGSVLAGASCT